MGRGLFQQRGRRRAAFVSLSSSYVATLLSFIKGVFLVPVFLSFFSIEVYGAWLASAGAIGFLGLLEFGLSPVLYQRLAFDYGRNAEQDFASGAGTGILIFGLVALAIGVVGIALAGQVVSLVRAPEGAVDVLTLTVKLSAAAAGIGLLTQALLAIPAAWQISEIGAIVRLTVQTVEIALTVVFLMLGKGVLALGLAGAGAAVLGLTLALVMIVRHWTSLGLPRPTGSLKTGRSLVRASSTVFLAKLSGETVGSIQTTLVSSILGPAAAAVFGLADRIFRFSHGLLNPIAGASMTALAHLFAEKGQSGARTPLAELASIWAIVSVMVVPPLLAIYAEFVSVWVGPELYGGFLFTAVFAVQSLFVARSFFMTSILLALGQIGRPAVWSAIEAGIRLPLLILGAHYMGLVGVAGATLVTQGVLNILVLPRIQGQVLGATPEEHRQWRGGGTVVVCITMVSAILLSLVDLGDWSLVVAIMTKGVVATVASTAACLLLLPYARQKALALARRFMPQSGSAK